MFSFWVGRKNIIYEKKKENADLSTLKNRKNEKNNIHGNKQKIGGRKKQR